jgi:hypothetical protein
VPLDKVNTLKIDKDCDLERDWLLDYIRTVLAIARMKQIRIVRIRICRSRRKGHHFYIDVKTPIPAKLANELQFLMGDDSQRVSYNNARIQSGLNEWSKLFERPHVRLRTIYHQNKRNLSAIGGPTDASKE